MQNAGSSFCRKVLKWSNMFVSKAVGQTSPRPSFPLLCLLWQDSFLLTVDLCRSLHCAKTRGNQPLQSEARSRKEKDKESRPAIILLSLKWYQLLILKLQVLKYSISNILSQIFYVRYLSQIFYLKYSISNILSKIFYLKYSISNILSQIFYLKYSI